MIGKLKILGVAFAAVLAIGAVTASAASAVQFHSESEKTFFKGEQTNFVFDMTAGTLTCKKVTYTGEGSATTSADITLAPVYSECTGFGMAATVDMNGCDYLYTTFVAHLICPAGKSMTITVGIPVRCTTHRYTGSKTYGLFSNAGSGTTRDLVFASEAGEGTEYEITYPKEGIPVCGKAGVYAEGKATGSFTLKGYKNAGLTEHTGIWIE